MMLVAVLCCIIFVSAQESRNQTYRITLGNVQYAHHKEKMSAGDAVGAVITGLATGRISVEATRYEDDVKSAIIKGLSNTYRFRFVSDIGRSVHSPPTSVRNTARPCRGESNVNETARVSPFHLSSYSPQPGICFILLSTFLMVLKISAHFTKSHRPRQESPLARYQKRQLVGKRGTFVTWSISGGVAASAVP